MRVIAVVDVESGAAEARHHYHQARAGGNRCRAITAVLAEHLFFGSRGSEWASRQEAQGGSGRLISIWRACKGIVRENQRRGYLDDECRSR